MTTKCPSCQFENPESVKFCGECGTPLPSSGGIHPEVTETFQTPIPELTTGSTFAGRYQVIEELGHGGMGRVYKVFDTEIKEKIALKLLKPEIGLDKEMIERFRNELKLARKISQRNVCRMHDLNREEGTYYITMEYVVGEDLKRLIRKVGQMSAAKTISIAKQVCEGLVEAHSMGIVHRDLKPQNIMVDEAGNAKIMDFGIARSLKVKGITGAGMMIGTPEYMSPEQVEGKEVDQRSDIYSLGVILYEMATGRVPFDGDTPFTIGVKHKSEIPKNPKEVNAQIPEDLSRLILRCLEKEKAKRCQTAAEVEAELRKIEKGIPTTERVVPEKKPLTSKQITVQFELKKLAIPAIVFIAVATVGLLLWKFLPRKEEMHAPKIENSIAVISFQNQTGDNSYDYLQEAIPNLLISGLEQSGIPYVVTWERLEDLLKQLGRPDVKTIDKDLGFRLCRMEGVESIVLGSFIKAENTFVTDVKVLDVESKKLIKSASARGEGLASILNSQIDELCLSVGKGLGLAKEKMDLEKLRVSGVTTDSMEAYQYYLSGMENLRRLYFQEAAEDLEKATAIDPEFATAYHNLFYVYYRLGNLNEANDAIRKAKQYASKATEKERLLIEAWYAYAIEFNDKEYLNIIQELIQRYPKEKYFYLILTQIYRKMGDYQKALEVIQKALALDPEYGEAHNSAGYVYIGLKDYDKAVRHLEKYIALNPRDPNPQDSLGDAYFFMGRLDDALASYTKTITLKPDFFMTYPKLAYVYALKEDYPKALELIDRRLAVSSLLVDQIGCGSWKAFYFFWLGSAEKGLSYLEKTMEIIVAQGEEVSFIGSDLLRTMFSYSMDKLELSRQANEAWFSTASKIVPPQYQKHIQAGHSLQEGLIDLKEKNIQSARDRLAEIRSLIPGFSLPSDREWGQHMADFLEAEILFQEKKFDQAIAIFDRMPHLPFPDLTNYQEIIEANLEAQDIKARSFEGKGDLDRAIAEYERLTTFDSKSENRCLIYPKFYYRLAKLYEQRGDRAKASQSYEKFLELWKDADPGLPEVEDARKRLEELQDK